MQKTIFFVAGHSGGHIIPCATQARKEKATENCLIYFITTNSKLDKQIINNFNFIDHKIYLSLHNIPKNPIKLLKFLWNLKKSFFNSLMILKKNKPSKIVSMGGIISIPVCLAGKILNIPIELWELNVEPGKTVKFLAKFVDKLNICFEDTKNYFPNKNCQLASYPIRFNETSKHLQKNLIMKEINFSNDKQTILIIGGSQGSQYINNLFKNFILQNIDLNNNLQIIHQTGSTDFDWKDFYKSKNIEAITFSFYDKMDEYYSIADLIICRSGAGTLAEVQFFEKKCITIPLETNTTSHQILNANCLAKKFPEKFKVIKQNDSEKFFDKEIKEMLNLK